MFHFRMINNPQKNLTMPKQTPIKSNLSGVILISFLVLGASTFFSLSKAEKNIIASSSIDCAHELIGEVIGVKSTDGTRLMVSDKKGNTYFPFISSENTMLTENKSVSICYKSIDASNPDHKIIYIEKVVSLPSPNEKR